MDNRAFLLKPGLDRCDYITRIYLGVMTGEILTEKSLAFADSCRPAPDPRP